jgi:predicted nucleic acid-binding protein
LFERVALSSAVQAELTNVDAPPEVQRWIAEPPEWLEIHETTGLPQESGLDEGEAAAIALAESLQAGMLLID